MKRLHVARTRGERRSIWSRPLARWVGVVTLVVLGGFTTWLWFSVRIGVVISDSMTDTFQRGDTYVIRTDAYRKEPPQRGDIVVIRHPENHETLVKRVVGIEGDWIGVDSGHVWINGAWVSEPYTGHEARIRERPTLVSVPEGKLFVMGDNRNFSEDSRDIGTLSVSNVMGRVVAIILPRARRVRVQRVDLKAPPPSNVPWLQKTAPQAN